MTMLRTRAICFDFQETLARFREGDAYDLYVEAAAEHGITLTRAQLEMPSADAWAEFATPDGPNHRQHSWTESSYVEIRAGVHARRLTAAGVDPDVAVRIGRRVDQFESQAHRYVAFDDALPALEALARAGMRFVVVSNHVWRLSEIVQTLFGSRFETTLTSAREGIRKPHPLIFERALYHLGIEPHEAEAVIMVGDSYTDDILGARRVGMRTALLDRTGEHADDEEARVLRSLTELTSMLR